MTQSCHHCRGGTYRLCGSIVFTTRPPYDGILAKHYINDADFCYKVPGILDLEQAAMVEPLFVPVAVGKTADLTAHQTIFVLDHGPSSVSFCKLNEYLLIEPWLTTF